MAQGRWDKGRKYGGSGTGKWIGGGGQGEVGSEGGGTGGGGTGEKWDGGGGTVYKGNGEVRWRWDRER